MGTLCPVPSTTFPTPLPCSLWCKGSRYKCNCSNFFRILLGERIFLLLKGISNPLAIPFISSVQRISKYQPMLALAFTHCRGGAHSISLRVCETQTATARRRGRRTTTGDSFINIEGQPLRNNAELTTCTFYL